MAKSDRPTSAFDGLIAARRNAEPEPPEERTAAVVLAPERRGPGRLPGKKSDPDFGPLTGYVRRDTIKMVKAALLQDDGEYSVLLQRLLERYLKERNDADQK